MSPDDIQPGTDLSGADLSETDRHEADPSEADLREVTLAGAALSRGTEIGTPSRRIEQEFEDNDWIPEEETQDRVARVPRELRAAYSDNGLLSRARTARVRERRARRREAKAKGGLRSTAAWFGSRLSGIFTGYGVRLLPVVAWMLALYLLSAVIYWQLGGMGWRYSLYYSVVTFTTAPPEAPPAGIPAVVASIETFAGTAAIVFLGYILGSRERV